MYISQYELERSGLWGVGLQRQILKSDASLGLSSRSELNANILVLQLARSTIEKIEYLVLLQHLPSRREFTERPKNTLEKCCLVVSYVLRKIKEKLENARCTHVWGIL